MSLIDRLFPPYKLLGKKPARHAISFKFPTYFDLSSLPPVPPVFGHIHSNTTPKWGILGNDLAGDCVFAGAGHESMAWALAQRRPVPRFTDEIIVQQYSEQTGYVIGDDSTDNGTDMQEAASYRRKTGLLDADGVRHKVKAYVEIPMGAQMIDQVLHAAYLFGAAGVGLQLPQSAMDQFDAGQPWTTVKHSKNLGGHYLPCVGRSSAGNLILVTWGKLQAATPEFLQAHMDEACAYLSDEYLDAKGISPEMIDSARLDADLRKLGA